MSSSQVVFALAKVLIATAWSDGKITQEETLSLKDLLFRLPNITGRDWANLEMYIETPISDGERRRLIKDLQQTISSPEDKTLALQTLQDMVEADGVFSDDEKTAVQEVHAALEGFTNSALGSIAKLLKGLMSLRSEKLADAPNRELQFEDFMKNKIYYNLQQRLKKSGRDLDIQEADLRKICLAGGMMARIARSDKIVTKEESSTIIAAFKKHWEVDDDTANFIAEVSLSKASSGLDYYRLSRVFFETTTKEERTHFISILFDVARSDGEASYEEMEEIRSISQSLKLDHDQFILAKTTISIP